MEGRMTSTISAPEYGAHVRAGKGQLSKAGDVGFALNGNTALFVEPVNRVLHHIKDPDLMPLDGQIAGKRLTAVAGSDNCNTAHIV